MSQSLLERVAALKARALVLESVEGSGYHDKDVDHWNRLRAPHMRHLSTGCDPGSPPLPRLSEHVVAFYDDRDILFVGECARRVLDALHAYREKYAAYSPIDRTGSELKMVEKIPKLAIKDDRLVLWRQDWNDYLSALHEMGVRTTGTAYEANGEVTSAFNQR